MSDDKYERARRRALRAAQAATLGIAMAATGCSTSHEPARDAGPVADGGAPAPDAGRSCDPASPPDTPECCAEQGGFWDPAFGCAIAVPGPFVPPAMV